MIAAHGGVLADGDFTAWVVRFQRTQIDGVVVVQSALKWVSVNADVLMEVVTARLDPLADESGRHLHRHPPLGRLEGQTLSACLRQRREHGARRSERDHRAPW